MAIIDQNFEKSLRKRFNHVKAHSSKNNLPVLFGAVKQILPYVKAKKGEQKHPSIYLQETVFAFEKLEPTDLVGYAKPYQIGFPLGIGALKYYATNNDPTTISTSPTGLLDLPGGAENKLNLILHNKDPFRHTPSEMVNKLKHIL